MLKKSIDSSNRSAQLSSGTSVDRFGRLTHLVGFNILAIGAVFLRHWPDGTAVALYWCESLMFVLSVAILVTIHRRLTNKSGHYFNRGTYNKSFLITSFVCALISHCAP